MPDETTEPATPDESTDEPERPQDVLSQVYHDLNNSLAVISGNAQLLAELARAEELGPAFTEPLQDVKAARMDISETLDRLDRLRAAARSPGEEAGREEARE